MAGVTLEFTLDFHPASPQLGPCMVVAWCNAPRRAHRLMRVIGQQRPAGGAAPGGDHPGIAAGAGVEVIAFDIAALPGSRPGQGGQQPVIQRQLLSLEQAWVEAHGRLRLPWRLKRLRQAIEA
jgi:hypothetical protein